MFFTCLCQLLVFNIFRFLQMKHLARNTLYADALSVYHVDQHSQTKIGEHPHPYGFQRSQFEFHRLPQRSPDLSSMFCFSFECALTVNICIMFVSFASKTLEIFKIIYLINCVFL